MRTKSSFFTAMSLFFTNSPSKKKTPPSRRKIDSFDKRTYIKNRSERENAKNRAATTRVVEFIDLTEDEVPAIKFQIIDDALNEIPVLIQLKYDDPNRIVNSSFMSNSVDCKPVRDIRNSDLDTNIVFVDSEMADVQVEQTMSSNVEIADTKVQFNKTEQPLIVGTSGSHDDEICEITEIPIYSESDMKPIKNNVKSVQTNENLNVTKQSSLVNGRKKILRKVLQKKNEKLKAEMFSLLNGLYFCSICERSFSEVKYLKTHIKSHIPKTNYKCSICRESFRWETLLVKHLAEHLTSCNLTKNIETQLMDDRVIERGMKEVESSVFNELEDKSKSVTNCSSSLIKLITDKDRDYSNLILACGYCDLCFDSQNALVDHCRVHMIDQPFMCNICGMLFKNKDSLVDHTRIHFQMIRCRKKVSSTPYIKYVLKIYSCQDCDRSYVSWASLNQHRIVVHRNRSTPGRRGRKKRIICPDAIINKNRSSDTLSNAVILPPQTSDVINTADQIFSSRKCMKVHKQTHFKPYQCSCCRKKYRYANSLATHLKTHNNQSPVLECSLCDQSFNELNVLKKHFASHSRKKSYNCDRCEGKFESGNAMNCHYSNHMEVQYSCSTCNSNLTAHTCRNSML